MNAGVDLELLQRIALQRHFEPETLEIAKRMMVFGEPVKNLAAEYGLNHQRIYAIRKEVLAAVRLLELPRGWEQVTLAGPRELIAELKAQHARALREYSAQHAEPSGRRPQ